MKELGEYLKRTRISNGVSLTEACEDLEFSTSHLEKAPFSCANLQLSSSPVCTKVSPINFIIFKAF